MRGLRIISDQELRLLLLYRRDLLQKIRLKLEKPPKQDSAPEEVWMPTAEDLLQSDIEWFLEKQTPHRARVVILKCRELNFPIPESVMEIHCKDLQKQVDDYELKHPRFSNEEDFRRALGTCVSFGKLLGVPKNHIFKEIAEAIELEDTEATPAADLLKDMHKRYLKKDYYLNP